ncbi:MAG: HAD family hydrolase [Deltaproteobacteria bacterium]|nr:HAD family hydrolase [Deltaproteobacteria bacterium]
MPLRKKLDELVKNVKKPIAIFDLDGTLFDVTYRTMEILKRFIAQPEIRARFPEQVLMASKLRYQDYVYSLDASLTGIGIDRYSEHAAHFLHAAETYWYKHFFTDPLMAADVPYPGALACVRHLRENGAQIVYLSGRDIPNMSQGTIAALEKGGFPHTGHDIVICLKPAYGRPG